MTLSFPTSPSNGTQYTDLNGKVWEFDGTKWERAVASANKTFVGVKAIIQSEIALTSTLTAIEWEDVEHDTSNFYNENDQSALVIPRTGYYRVHLSLSTGQNGWGASYTINLRRSGVNFFSENMSAYQSGQYDDIYLLNVGDVIKLYASEYSGVGTISSDFETFLEIQLVGYTFGGAITPGFEFSGVKAILQNPINTTDTPTEITWTTNDIQFNVNANAAGNVYWSNVDPTKFTISTAGYYRLRSFFLTGSPGGQDSYTVLIRKNGSESVEQVSLGSYSSVELDETIYFDADDYIEILVDNVESIGEIQETDTFFEITRLGV